MPTVTLKRTTSADPDFRELTLELDADLRLRNGDVMDIYDQHNVIETISTVVIAYLDEIQAGCGCFKSYSAQTAELKRMYVKPEARGRHLSTRLLTELELWAQTLGFVTMVLETGNRQTEALALYSKAGYQPIPAYGPYADLPDSLCFSKELQ